MNNSTRKIKTKVLLNSYGVLVFWLLIFIVKFIFVQFPANFNVDIGFCVAFIIMLLLSRRKYFISMRVENEQLYIEYFTPFAQKKVFTVAAGQLPQYKYERGNWFLYDADYIVLNHDGIWVRFCLINKWAKNEAAEKLFILDAFVKNSIVAA
jgi:hypothetical protein